eukprot:CAMPEP_0116045096 /NCGR_PEP_ID=MMETSP0321-20121206/27401_1 /TAXON_ID=163516 /ORGANISM="Leptocylindrus danicus var. danicus, Strain B650" /LENGTH=788 /DNA_ID=CAMNT_0003526337 /DNA_START=845 /DNA_END=3213 /DNA_ORIENTATION=+
MIGSEIDEALIDEDTEMESLMHIFNATFGKTGHWNNDNNWGNSSISICDWHGVSCPGLIYDEETATYKELKTVVSIDLSDNNLRGAFPLDHTLVNGRLPHLSKLDLHNNPALLFDFAPSIGSTSSFSQSVLQYINLSDISRVQSLNFIHAFQNTLAELLLESSDAMSESGDKNIPSAIFDLQNLERLHLGDNSFQGSIPSEISKLSNLKYLSLDKNELTGDVNKKLKDLSLSENNFSGEFVYNETLGLMVDLYELDLSSAGLSGTLPDLHKVVDLRNNNFSGSVPWSFFSSIDPEQFSYGEFGSNNIKGEIPSSAMIQSIINKLFLQDNQITGIPPTLCFTEDNCDTILCRPGTFSPIGRDDEGHQCHPCPSTTYYGSVQCATVHSSHSPTISRQTFSPSVSPTSRPSKQPQNLLSRMPSTTAEPPSIPATLSPSASASTSSSPTRTLTDRYILTKLYDSCNGHLWHEQKFWTSQHSICDWYGIECDAGSENVKSISLSANNLHGSIPTELFQLKRLEKLSIYSNEIELNFGGVGNAKLLTHLLIDGTGLGSLDGIGQAQSLQVLSARFNKLETLPSELSMLTNLRKMSLTDNKIETSISQLVIPENLEALLLGGNAINGKLDRFNPPPTMRYIDLSGNELYGPIPSFLLQGTPSSMDVEIDLSSNMLTGTLPVELARFDRLEFYAQNNQIRGMNSKLCEKTEWNGGNVEVHGCDAILCPKGYASTAGRAMKNRLCEECNDADEAPFLGSTTCAKKYIDSAGMNLGNGIVNHILSVSVVAVAFLFSFS